MNEDNLDALNGDGFLQEIAMRIDQLVAHAVRFPEVGLDLARALDRIAEVEYDVAFEHGCHGECLCDECAVGMMKCLEAYASVCENWGPVVEVMMKADQHAVCEDTIAAARGNLSIVKANFEHQKLHATCWSCHKEPATKDDAFVVKMFKKLREFPSVKVDRSPEIEWRTVGVEVPLCHSCAMRRQSCDEAKRYSDFPEVKKLLADGYQFGVQPERGVRGMIMGESLDPLEDYRFRPLPMIPDVSQDCVTELEYPCD